MRWKDSNNYMVESNKMKKSPLFLKNKIEVEKERREWNAYPNDPASLNFVLKSLAACSTFSAFYSFEYLGFDTF